MLQLGTIGQLLNHKTKKELQMKKTMSLSLFGTIIFDQTMNCHKQLAQGLTKNLQDDAIIMQAAQFQC